MTKCSIFPGLGDAFGSATEGIYLRTRSDGRLFNLARLKAKTKVREVLIRDMLFADDAAVASHTQQELQSLMKCFSQACKDFGLTISFKKTNVLGQDTETPPLITIFEYELDADFAGWATSTAWTMGASQNTSSMESWHLEGEAPDAHSYVTRMS